METAGGFFELSTVPIQAQEAVSLDAIVAESASGTPANGTLPSANTGQLITLQGFGFSAVSNIIFQGVAADGTRGVIVVRPTSVLSSTEMRVVVPAFAVTGAVTVSGSSIGVDLQVVPTLNGIGSARNRSISNFRINKGILTKTFTFL